MGRFGKAEDFRLASRLSCCSSSSIDFISQSNYGLGVAVVSGLCLVDADRSSMEIVEIPAELGGESTYGVVVRKDKHRSRLLADLLMLLGVGGAKRS